MVTALEGVSLASISEALDDGRWGTALRDGRCSNGGGIGSENGNEKNPMDKKKRKRQTGLKDEAKKAKKKERTKENRNKMEGR